MPGDQDRRLSGLIPVAGTILAALAVIVVAATRAPYPDEPMRGRLHTHMARFCPTDFCEYLEVDGECMFVTGVGEQTLSVQRRVPTEECDE